MQGNIDGRNAALVMDNANVNFGAGGNVSSITGNQVNFTGESGSSVTENDNTYTLNSGGSFKNTMQSVLSNDKVAGWLSESYANLENAKDSGVGVEEAQNEYNMRKAAVAKYLSSDLTHLGGADKSHSDAFRDIQRMYTDASMTGKTPGLLPVQASATTGVNQTGEHAESNTMAYKENLVTKRIEDAFSRTEATVDFMDRQVGGNMATDQKADLYRSQVQGSLVHTIEDMEKIGQGFSTDSTTPQQQDAQAKELMKPGNNQKPPKIHE